jgi:two-component system, cell cycle response regulator
MKKNVVLVGFTHVQIDLARKFFTYRSLDSTISILPEVPTPDRVDAYIINADHTDIGPRIEHYLSIRPAMVLGTGAQSLPQMNDFVQGSFKPATVDRLVALLQAPPAVERRKTPRLSPLDISAHPQPGEEAASKVLNFPRVNTVMSASVLVVDDSEIVRKALVRKINEYGQRVDTASNGTEALEMMMQTRYQLVFLDIMMPGLDGFEVCKRIKKSSDYKSTAVYMLSSKDGVFDKVRGSMAGCNGYLVKPLEVSQLRATVLKHFAPPSAATAGPAAAARPKTPAAPSPNTALNTAHEATRPAALSPGARAANIAPTLRNPLPAANTTPRTASAPTIPAALMAMDLNLGNLPMPQSDPSDFKTTSPANLKAENRFKK